MLREEGLVCKCHINPPCQYCLEQVLCTECEEPVHPLEAYEVDEDNYYCKKCYKGGIK